MGVHIGALLVGESGLDLAGKLLLSSAQLEQSRSQPQNKGGPGACSFSLGSVVAARRLEVHIVSSGTGRLPGGDSIVASAGKIDLFVLSAEAQAQAGASVLAGHARSNVGAGGSVARDARGSKAALAAVLVEPVGLSALGAFLLADLLPGVLLLLGLFLLLELAACFADMLLARSSVDLASRAETETTHVERATQR